MKFQFKPKGFKASASGPSKKLKRGDPPPQNVDLVDNGDQTWTLVSYDAAGNVVDTSAVATLSVTSDTPATMTADIPATPPMTFAVHTLGPITPPGTVVKIVVTETWNDGSVGPFSAEIDYTTKTGPTTGVVAVPGAITTH